jgi:hypothetical protein
MYTRRSMFEKGIFFQLISTLFCEVNGGFVDPGKHAKLPCLGWRSANFYKVFPPPPKKKSSAYFFSGVTKISMGNSIQDVFVELGTTAGGPISFSISCTHKKDDDVKAFLLLEIGSMY